MLHKIRKIMLAGISRRSFTTVSSKCLDLDTTLLQKKFTGCLLGSLIGDCLGAPYEGDVISPGDRIVIQRYFDTLEKPQFKGPTYCYTDDSAMMKTLARSLIEKPEIDCHHIVKAFVKEFFHDPKRGYGQTVQDVFKKLRATKFVDIYKPAAEQFNGNGSYGNGGAMRISPVALYFCNNYEMMLENAKKITELTHTHSLGVDGALLQCIAIHQALLCDPNTLLNPEEFCENIGKKIKQLEQERDDGLNFEDSLPYGAKLDLVKHFLSLEYHDEIDEDVIQKLGNSISAYDSVPTAIYCFLRAIKGEIPGIATNNAFRRTIQYAISLGGDTDTIACMAGALAGAYLGEDSISLQLSQRCEVYTEIKSMACDLYKTFPK